MTFFSGEVFPQLQCCQVASQSQPNQSHSRKLRVVAMFTIDPWSIHRGGKKSHPNSLFYFNQTHRWKLKLKTIGNSGAIACEVDRGKTRYSTVGCRRTGGRRSQPGSFLFFTTPGNIVLIFQSDFESRRLACTRRRMPGGECGWNISKRRSGVVSKSAMPLKKSSSQQKLFACGETALNSFFQPGVVPIFRWNSSLAVLRQTVLRHPTVLYMRN